MFIEMSANVRLFLHCFVFHMLIKKKVIDVENHYKNLNNVNVNAIVSNFILHMSNKDICNGNFTPKTSKVM